jgi:hypothetical protein
MSVSLHHSSESLYPVAGSVGGRVVQTIQGWYYLFAGVVSVLAIWIAGQWWHSLFLWVAQVIGLAVAACGIALIRSGQRSAGPFIGGLLSACAALLLLVFTAAGLLAGALTSPFLIDTGLEFMFVCWWAITALYVSYYTPNSVPH